VQKLLYRTKVQELSQPARIYDSINH